MTQSEINDFAGRLRLTIQEYIDQEDSYCDDMQLAINPVSLTAEIAEPDEDLPELDYYSMMDLISTSPTEPGRWIPDEDTINEIAASYNIID